MLTCNENSLFGILGLVLFIGVWKVFAEFILHPRSTTIAYGELATFQCTIDDPGSFSFYWTVNSTQVTRGSTLHSEGLQVSSVRLGPDIRSTTLTVNGSFYVFNNATIQCGFYDRTSNSAQLQIQAPPAELNLTVLYRNSESIVLGWAVPERIVLHPHNVDVKYYQVEIKNNATGDTNNMSVEGIATKYHFTTKDSRFYCSFLQFCVRPVRSAGVGEIKECVNTSFKRGVIVNGPTSVVSPKGYSMSYECTISCPKTTLITWMLNGSLLSSWPYMKYSVGNDHEATCHQSDMSPNSTYMEYLEVDMEGSMQLQCVSIYKCNGTNSEDCIPTVCFSQELHISIPAQSRTTSSASVITTNATINPMEMVEGRGEILHTFHSYSLEQVYALIGATAVLGLAMVVSCLVIILLVFYKRKTFHQKGKEVKFAANNYKSAQEDAIYELCGGPTAKTESVYDKPKTPSPQPHMNPCEAYSTVPAAS